MKKPVIIKLISFSFLMAPMYLFAQVGNGIVTRYQKVLNDIYKDNITLAGDLLPVAQAIAGFGALWYIGDRVWKHIAAAESIDFYPLFRPFVIILLITFYNPLVLGVLNGILQPTVTATAAMVNNTNTATEVLITERSNAISQSKEYQELAGEIEQNDSQWDVYKNPSGKGGDPYMTKPPPFSFNILTNSILFFIKLIISFFLQLIYYAAILCIDTLRTFHLLILAILGPIVLCLSVYNGLQHTLQIWIARYINIFLWLPVANLFGAIIGKVQQGMLKADLAAMQKGQLASFGTTDIAYMIFLVIAVIGYFSVPSIANYIVHASGANTIVSKINNISSAGRMVIMTGAGAVAGATGSLLAGSISGDHPGSDMHTSSMADAKNSEPYIKDRGYNHNKISGNS